MREDFSENISKEGIKMKLRFRTFLMVFVGLSLLLLSGSAFTQDIYLFKFAHSQPLTHPRHQSMLLFKDLVEEASQGKIQVELYGAGILGTESEVMDMVKVGTVQGTRGGLFERANKKFLLYTLPFLFENPEQALRVVRSDFGERINKEAEANGYYIPVTGLAGGFRQFTNNKRAIEVPEDMKGLKMRTPPIDTIIRTMSALGASPQQVPYTEVYMALKTGVVDGQENPPSNITEMKFYEVQKYFTKVNYQVHPDPFFANLEWYQNLPDDLKAIFIAAAKAAMKYSDAIWLAKEDGYRAFLETQLETNYISEENRPLFVKKIKSVWQHYVDKDYFTQAEIDEALAVAAGK
jgi:tripartite ATP-independent transporter DctP family solute receptor